MLTNGCTHGNINGTRKPPEGIFILRHGARLDQFDQLWIHNNPTPYDPPLTPKGIFQSNISGQAILAHLSDRPRRRLIIHTSPFLRCLQTALYLSLPSSILRIDEWLGEWLTPDYYQDIDPPPPSALHANNAIQSFTSYREMNHLQMDWAWNTSRLGSGGEYGEEWHTMQSRFANGLSALLRYYISGEDFHIVPGNQSSRSVREATGKEEDDEETVVVIVTHGAGVNALLGALTGSPILIDIPVSSLSYATLSSFRYISPSVPEYEVRIKASIEHLDSANQDESFQLPPADFAMGGRSGDNIEKQRIREREEKVKLAKETLIQYHPVRSRSVTEFSKLHQQSSSPITSSHFDTLTSHPSWGRNQSSWVAQPMVASNGSAEGGLFNPRMKSGSISKEPPTSGVSSGLWSPLNFGDGIVDIAKEREGNRGQSGQGLWSRGTKEGS